MEKKWYIFEGCAEGDRADMALLSPEEAEVIKRFFENKIEFYDEGYAGTYDMLPCGPFDSKEEVIEQFMEGGIRFPDDLIDEFQDMYKGEEEKDEVTNCIPYFMCAPDKEEEE